MEYVLLKLADLPAPSQKGERPLLGCTFFLRPFNRFKFNWTRRCGEPMCVIHNPCNALLKIQKAAEQTRRPRCGHLYLLVKLPFNVAGFASTVSRMGKASQISSTNHLNNNNKTRISGNFCREQIELASKAVIFNATAPLKPDEPKTEGSPAPQHNNKPITLVGGLDITPVQPAAPQNWPFIPEPAVACLVIISMPDLSTVYEDQITIQLQVPYIPSYLGFR